MISSRSAPASSGLSDAATRSREPPCALRPHRQDPARRVPATAGDNLERTWEDEWRTNRLRAALKRLRQQVNPAQYEIYHLRVIEGHSSRATAHALGVSMAQVYLAKLRVGRLLQAEVKRLEAAERGRWPGTPNPA